MSKTQHSYSVFTSNYSFQGDGYSHLSHLRFKTKTLYKIKLNPICLIIYGALTLYELTSLPILRPFNDQCLIGTFKKVPLINVPENYSKN